MSDQSIAGPYGALPVYVAEPEGPGPWPGVVVIHDAIGMSADVRRQADWLASSGFVAAAPDLMARGVGTFRCMRQMMGEARVGQGRSFDEIEAARSWLVARPDCTGRTGVVGFCMGGGFALMLAPRGTFDASSVNYGAAGRDAYSESFLTGSCPIVGSFGRKDPSLRGAAARLEQALTALDVPHDVKEYPDASHSFLNDHDPADLKPMFRLTAMLGMRYHEASAVDARRRIVAFFDEHLR
jgi:carboxymethylenebutenolidase